MGGAHNPPTQDPLAMIGDLCDHHIVSHLSGEFAGRAPAPKGRWISMQRGRVSTMGSGGGTKIIFRVTVPAELGGGHVTIQNDPNDPVVCSLALLVAISQKFAPSHRQ